MLPHESAIQYCLVPLFVCPGRSGHEHCSPDTEHQHPPPQGAPLQDPAGALANVPASSVQRLQLPGGPPANVPPPIEHFRYGSPLVGSVTFVPLSRPASASVLASGAAP